MSKPVLVIMAHGSRKQSANEEFIHLVGHIEQRISHYSAVKYCFLELACPSLADTIQEAHSSGHDHFDIYPLFFNEGNHVSRDIPKQIAAIKTQLPLVNITQLDYFGSYCNMANTVIDHIIMSKLAS